MRGALLIGTVVVLLIIGLLVMKNMGVDNPAGDQETQTEVYIEEARDVAKDVDKKLNNIKRSGNEID
ncbi:hypothetical protein D1AOALGA4SA_1622 [Olavius algarvensis Delta 1 endosymbiont]|nr:hypothetical protein D1AOALGA4SA_1622 [Olavius algarvensis Delta 1 endosymbiont]